MKSIGVGLIGSGFMGKAHALAWNAVRPVFGDVPAIRLAHLGDANDALARAKADEFGFAKASGDWRQVVADPEVDVVSITTPNKFHLEMAAAALAAGKDVWCEKPMAPNLADAEKMLAAARQSGKVAVLGYNYVQNPVIRHISKLIGEGAIGAVNHVRIEMDEDFMADPEAPFQQRHEKANGWGAIDDFAVHPLSLILTLFGPLERVMCDMAKPYSTRKSPEGEREVEVFDIATILMRLKNGASGFIAVSRTAWGRKGRIAIQIFGAKGSILFDQERLNEFQLYLTSDGPTEAGFRTVLSAPHHKPYDRFIPAPGHSLGFNDLKTIECRQLIGRMLGEEALSIDFEKGILIERAVDAMARSFQEGRWVDLG
ncbi:Gfo/Idh/MocA family oxidoreductase [Mesorhizobium sp. BAC0120]|uniref:Gfo/Idh/MocA family protein n=1 Tax=Mesorhizobium sp. BAC0120 TaxID=3090670 RepID=UPI00298C57E6|nr:Gfo/Idh/MocA family oxidoreductase [Mesorhizobium sp. BAC0120]MDW6025574.1 Gfo/Idh/MocA family oxidoreductase [Mesorhizobium sp. BAC0120]